MINVKAWHFETVLWLAMALLIVISSCHGQPGSSEQQKGMASGSLLHQNPSRQNDQSAKQISQVVRTVFQDSRGDIWFGTQNGAFRLSGKSLVHIDRIRSESGKGVTIKDIGEDSDGKVWLGHTDGISRVDGDLVTNYYESDGLISNDVWCISPDRNGNIWIGTIEGVCVFDGREFTDFDLPEGKIDSTLGISSTRMTHSIMEDSKGTLWFSTNAGLFSYADNKLIDVSKKLGIQTIFINEVVEDQDGGFWISTKGDLYSFKENELHNITGDKIEVGKGIGSIVEDGDGIIWFVANQHDLYTYDGTELVEFLKTEDNSGPVVFKLFKDQGDRLWVVGYGGAFRLENGIFLHITTEGPW